MLACPRTCWRCLESVLTIVLALLIVDRIARAALRTATLNAGKFAWQMLWTGGAPDSIGGTGLGPLVGKASCAANLRAMCDKNSP